MPDRTKRAADVTLAKQWIESAAVMGAPILRVFAGARPAGHTWDTAASWVAEALAECVDHAGKHGVIIGVQNHGDMLSSAAEVLKLLGMVKSEWLGVIVDTGQVPDAGSLRRHCEGGTACGQLAGQGSA